MNGNPADDNKEKLQGDFPPTEGSESEHRGKNKITSENVNRTGKKQSQAQWPNWIMAVASILLVLVTFFYTDYARQQTHLTREGLDATRATLNENTKQFSATLEEMKEQTRAAQTASDAAKKAATAASRSAESAGRQIAVMKEQTNAAMDAMRFGPESLVGLPPVRCSG